MPVPDTEADKIVASLRRWAGWDQVPDAVMRELAHSAEIVAIPRKRPIFRRGEPGPGLFLVRSGEFKLSLISSEGREQILYLAEPGKIISEGFLPRDVQCAASAFAMTDGSVYRFPSTSVLALIGRSEALARALMRHMAFRTNRLIDLVLDLSLRSVQRRLAAFLCTLAARHGAEPGKPCTIPRDLDMNTVAARLGTVREEISRAMNRMQRQGILQLSRHEIVVLDLDALERVTYE